jgi:hypothetical protein
MHCIALEFLLVTILKSIFSLLALGSPGVDIRCYAVVRLSGINVLLRI